MKIHDVAQGSTDWAILRSGIPTASEFDALVTPEFKLRTGETPKTYLAKKIAEWWQGGPLIGFNTFAVEQGQIIEAEAKPWYTLEYGEEIQNVGFITDDAGTVGCSPDGLIGDDGGIEIKSPQCETHVSYLLAGELPKQYAAQVHGSMFVTGRAWWKFLSYRRHFPPVLLTIHRDEIIIGKLLVALNDFLTNFLQAKARMIEINGGPPVRKPAQVSVAQNELGDRFPMGMDVIP